MVDAQKEGDGGGGVLDALKELTVVMDKLQLTGQNLDRVFNSRGGCVCATQLCCLETKLPHLMLKTRPRQLLGSLPFDITLPAMVFKAQGETNPNIYEGFLFSSLLVGQGPMF